MPIRHIIVLAKEIMIMGIVIFLLLHAIIGTAMKALVNSENILTIKP